MNGQDSGPSYRPVVRFELEVEHPRSNLYKVKWSTVTFKMKPKCSFKYELISNMSLACIYMHALTVCSSIDFSRTIRPKISMPKSHNPPHCDERSNFRKRLIIRMNALQWSRQIVSSIVNFDRVSTLVDLTSNSASFVFICSSHTSLYGIYLI